MMREETIQSWLEKLYNSGDVPKFEKQLEELVQQENDAKLLEAASARLIDAEGPAARLPEEFSLLTDRLKHRKKELEIKSLSAQVRLTQRLGDQDEQMRLLEKLKELRSR